MYIDRDRELAKRLISTKICIGGIHLLNNGVVCKMEDSDEMYVCSPCVFKSIRGTKIDGEAGCVIQSASSLGINERNVCYSSIRNDKKKITKILHKSLFIISLIRNYESI